ncbi:hypothetical protein, partial [Parasphingorhabdus sp.]|uniref:hypothetical protein n=1 Tax=Parasphingorhabdus sp. TaxID=2709688 RepID=UPI00329932D0
LHGMQEVSGSIPLGSTNFSENSPSGGRATEKFPNVSDGSEAGGTRETSFREFPIAHVQSPSPL